jgi:hypothetical protein
MTTSALGIVIIVSVVAAGLVVWISTVYRADKHRKPAEDEPPGARSPEGSAEATRASRCRAAMPRPRS